MNYKLLYQDLVYRTLMADYHQGLLGNYLKYLNWWIIEPYSYGEYYGCGFLSHTLTDIHVLFTSKYSEYWGDGTEEHIQTMIK